MNSKIIIIGGGASALMLASLLPKNSTIIIENSSRLGEKILVSGGGKCNITNKEMGCEYYAGDNDFIETVLSCFDERSLLKWLADRKLKPVLRKESQYFCEHSAKELLNIFLKESRRQKIILGEKVVGVTKRGEYFSVRTDRRTLNSKYVVVASGGLSYPKLGATPVGYEIAEEFGHSVGKTAPALVGFTVQKEQFFFKELSGASTDVEIKIDGIICKGSLLFAHRGISGPAVMDASLYWEKGKIEVDFLLNFSLQAVKKSKKLLSSLLPMPKRVTKRFLVQLNLDDKEGNKITADELSRLKHLKHYSFAPAGTFGYSKAEVTKGGICTDDIDAATMMSQKTKGLYFTGEVLNVTGRLGGYNLQWAFSSAYACALSLDKEIE